AGLDVPAVLARDAGRRLGLAVLGWLRRRAWVAGRLGIELADLRRDVAPRHAHVPADRRAVRPLRREREERLVIRDRPVRALELARPVVEDRVRVGDEAEARVPDARH